MPHDCEGTELKVGDIVTLRARVTHLYPQPDYCNMNIEGLDGADNPASKATCTINTRAVKLLERPPAPDEQVTA